MAAAAKNKANKLSNILRSLRYPRVREGLENRTAYPLTITTSMIRQINRTSNTASGGATGLRPIARIDPQKISALGLVK